MLPHAWSNNSVSTLLLVALQFDCQLSVSTKDPHEHAMVCLSLYELQQSMCDYLPCLQAAKKVEQLTQALQTSNSNATAEQAQLAQQLQAASQRADNTAAELEAVVTSGKALQAKITQLQKQVNEQSSDLVDSRQQAAQDKARLVEQLSGAQNKAAELTSQMAEASSAADRQQADLTAQMEELQAAVQSGEAALADCKAELAAAEARHASASAAAAEGSQAVARLEGQVSDKTQQLQAQGAELGRTKQSLQVWAAVCLPAAKTAELHKPPASTVSLMWAQLVMARVQDATAGARMPAEDACTAIPQAALHTV